MLSVETGVPYAVDFSILDRRGVENSGEIAESMRRLRVDDAFPGFGVELAKGVPAAMAGAASTTLTNGRLTVLFFSFVKIFRNC